MPNILLYSCFLIFTCFLCIIIFCISKSKNNNKVSKTQMFNINEQVPNALFMLTDGNGNISLYDPVINSFTASDIISKNNIKSSTLTVNNRNILSEIDSIKNTLTTTKISNNGLFINGRDILTELDNLKNMLNTNDLEKIKLLSSGFKLKDGALGNIKLADWYYRSNNVSGGEVKTFTIEK